MALLHGRGGFGKSTLLKRYREIALEYRDAIQVSDLIDWEFAAQERRALFNPAEGEDIDASQYFSFLREQLALALDKQPTDFKEYQSAVKAVDEARKQARGILEGLQREGRYGWLRTLTGEGVLALMRAIPYGSLLLSSDVVSNAIRDAASEGVTIGAEQITQVWTRLHERLGNQLGDYLQAPWRLGRGIGYDLAQFARKHPILIFFDTYEEIDEGDTLLQMIMGAAGGRVGWVIAGRDNLWAGVGQRHRSLELEYGYRDLVLADRRMVVDFSADGVGDFTSSDIEEYFAILRQKARQPALPIVTEKDAVHIRDVTDGVPLAVKIAAGLYVESQSLEPITESLDGKREIVDQMVERYLLHTRTNPADRARLYGLALLRRPDEQRSLAAALDVPDHYDAELSRLHRRYGFIFTKQEKPALHQEVRHFLRLWLLQHRTSSPDILRVVRRLREAVLTSFQELEAQRNYASLRVRLEDEQWVELYLDLTEQQFWLDSAEGVSYILPFMFAASVYHRDANREARAIGEFFQETLARPYRKQWEWANQSLVYSTSRNPLPEELAGLKDLVRLASQTRITLPVPPLPEDLEAALWWRLGEAYRGKSPNKSVYWYEKALSRLPHERELREALTEAIWDKEHAAMGEEEPGESSAPELGETTSPGEIVGDRSEVDGVTRPDDPQWMLTELDRALEGDPKSVRILIQRGEAYMLLREYRRAIADFDRALELAPEDASLYAKRGDAYLLLKEYRRAVADFDHALAIEPSNEEIRTKQHEAADELTKPGQTSTMMPRRPDLPFRLSRSFPARRPAALAALLSIVALLILGGGGLGYYFIIFQPSQLHAQATAIAEGQTNATSSVTAPPYTPMFGFNPQHTHFNPDEKRLSTANVASLVLDWTASTNDSIFSSPAVANGVVYVASSNGYLYAFNSFGCGSASCSPLWTASTHAGIGSSPTVANGVVYIGSFDHKLYAFNASGCGSASCSPLWTASTDADIESSPAVANNVVYVGSGNGKLYAFNAFGCGSASCSPLWTSVPAGNSINSSPAVANGVVYVGSDDYKLYAFNAFGCGSPPCSPLWTASTNDSIFSSPAVANGVVYIGSRDGKLYAFNASGCGSASCSPLWTASTNDSIFSSPAVANGVVYVGSDDHKLYAFNASGCGSPPCSPLWTSAPTGDRIYSSSPLVINGVVYIGSFDHKLYAFHLPGTTP